MNGFFFSFSLFLEAAVLPSIGLVDEFENFDSEEDAGRCMS